MNKSSAIFGGAGLGILIGLLIGLSTSSVVGVVIGAISSILLVLLGFKEKGDSNVQTLRVGSFGLFCAGAILLGLYFRVNNSFTPSIKSDVDRWTSDSIFSVNEAKQFIVYERFGIIPEGAIIDSVKQKQSMSSITTLYSVDISLSECEKLKGYENFPIENELRAYKRLGGIWKRLSESIGQGIETENQKSTLHLIRKCLCDE